MSVRCKGQICIVFVLCMVQIYHFFLINHLKTCNKCKKNSDATALRDIQDLVSKGILIKGEGSGRSAHYLLAAPFTAARH